MKNLKIENAKVALFFDGDNEKIILTLQDAESLEQALEIVIDEINMPNDNLVNTIDYFGIEDINEKDTSIVFTKNLNAALSFLLLTKVISQSTNDELKKQLNSKKWEERKTPISLLFNEKQPPTFPKKETSPREDIEEAFKNFLDENSENINNMSPEKREEFKKNLHSTISNYFKPQHQIKSQ